jgi:hypothetical protein
VDNTTISIAAARLGAACPAARSPWTNVVAPVVGIRVGYAPVQRAAAHMTPRAQSAFLQAQSAFLMASEPLPTTNTVTFTRKPKNVHKTRINAGGYGAMGPHPEREPLA